MHIILISICYVLIHYNICIIYTLQKNILIVKYAKHATSTHDCNLKKHEIPILFWLSVDISNKNISNAFLNQNSLLKQALYYNIIRRKCLFTLYKI